MVTIAAESATGSLIAKASGQLCTKNYERLLEKVRSKGKAGA